MKIVASIVLFLIGSCLADDGDGPDGGLPPPPFPTNGPLPPFPTNGPLPPFPTNGPFPTQLPIPTDPPLPPLPTGTPAPPPQPETPAPTQAPPSDCKDKAYNCQQLQSACRNSWSIKTYWCKKTCGTCDEGNCRDRISNCYNNRRFCDRAAVALQCPRTCKRC